MILWQSDWHSILKLTLTSYSKRIVRVFFGELMYYNLTVPDVKIVWQVGVRWSVSRKDGLAGWPLSMGGIL